MAKLTLLLAGCLASMLATQGAAASYLRVQLDRVQFTSADGPDETWRLARNFVYMEHALARLTGLKLPPEMRGTTVWCLAKREWSAVTKDAPKSRQVDALSRVVDDRWLVILNGCSLQKEGLRRAFSVHAQHLLDSAGRADYPLWYRVGFANLMSSAEVISPTQMKVGSVPVVASPSIRSPGEVTAHELFDAKDWNEMPFRERVFHHGRAWTLVQYSVIGGAERQKRLNALGAAIAAGTPAETALRAHFGVDYQGLDKMLDAHLKTRPLAWKMHMPQDDLEAQVPDAQAVAAEEVAAFLAEWKKSASADD
jgi:hypothetical protein